MVMAQPSQLNPRNGYYYMPNQISPSICPCAKDSMNPACGHACMFGGSSNHKVSHTSGFITI